MCMCVCVCACVYVSLLIHLPVFVPYRSKVCPLCQYLSIYVYIHTYIYIYIYIYIYTHTHTHTQTESDFYQKIILIATMFGLLINSSVNLTSLLREGVRGMLNYNCHSSKSPETNNLNIWPYFSYRFPITPISTEYFVLFTSPIPQIIINNSHC